MIYIDEQVLDLILLKVRLNDSMSFGTGIIDAVKYSSTWNYLNSFDPKREMKFPTRTSRWRFVFHFSRHVIPPTDNCVIRISVCLYLFDRSTDEEKKLYLRMIMIRISRDGTPKMTSIPLRAAITNLLSFSRLRWKLAEKSISHGFAFFSLWNFLSFGEQDFD